MRIVFILKSGLLWEMPHQEMGYGSVMSARAAITGRLAGAWLQPVLWSILGASLLYIPTSATSHSPTSRLRHHRESRRCHSSLWLQLRENRRLRVKFSVQGLVRGGNGADGSWTA